MNRQFILASCAISLLLCSSCGRKASPEYTVTWHDLLEQLVQPDRIARLDAPNSPIVTSYDRTGGNNDFNNYLREGPSGWWVIADLKGPGYVSRFWFTGAESQEHRVRFYFDGERTPRIDMTIGELCGGAEPFLYPLGQYENYCWYTYIPIPYEESLVIMVERGGFKQGGWPRLFYQVNHVSLPEGQVVASFSPDLSERDLEVLRSIRDQWRRHDFFDAPVHTDTVRHRVTIQAGESAQIQWPSGPALIRVLRITPDYAARDSAMAREALMRDVVLTMSWNDQADASVEVPLGDFFGSVWRRQRFQSMYFGKDENTFISRFPKPYERSGSLALRNEGDEAVSFDVEADVEALPAWDSGWGYFHARWNRTSPQDVGRPHPIVNAVGAGKLAGCLLAVVSADQSWWILEADEWIRIDEEVMPGWRGTGLEDYFNGGWYYQNATVRPWNGISFKAPLRAVQYRLHVTDPVVFRSSIDMQFERGPGNNSRGWMESVAYYYMAEPQASGSRLGARRDRLPPDDPFAPQTVMTELNNMERLGDYRGASEFIDYFLERFPGFPFADPLRLRQIAYREYLEGFDVARPLYEAFMATTTNPAALKQAEDLLWFHEDPSHALWAAYCNTRTRLWINGRAHSTIEHPAQMFVFRVQLRPGTHVLGLQSRWKEYPDWVQAYLRTHQQDIYTTPEWRQAFNPSGNWSDPGYDADGWKPVGGTGVKGPPEIPYLWVEPHAYVNMQSKAVGLRPTEEWPDRSGYFAFRTTFTFK